MLQIFGKLPQKTDVNKKTERACVSGVAEHHTAVGESEGPAGGLMSPDVNKTEWTFRRALLVLQTWTMWTFCLSKDCRFVSGSG